MKLVKEHINEKFIEDSDPIHDMGIGSSYWTIQPGAIIVPKRTFTLSRRTGIPTGWRSGVQLREYMSLLILDIKNITPKLRSFIFYRCYSLEYAKTMQLALKNYNGDYSGFVYEVYKLNIGPKAFENRFKIIEKGL